MRPRDLAVAFAARAALRVLPIVWEAQRIGHNGDQLSDIALSVFRATAIAWARAVFPIRSREFAIAAAEASYAATKASGAAPAASQAARAAAFAAEGAFVTGDALFAAVDVASDAAFAADAVAAFWSAVSSDATRVEEEGVAASDIAGSPLWQRQRFHYHSDRQPVVELVKEQPDRLRSLWLELKATLVAANDHWDVWTDWYDDRLDGRIRNEKRELAYVRIEDALWNQGPAVVNAEIRRLVDELEPPHGTVQLEALGQSTTTGRAPISVAERAPPIPIENVPSAVSFGLTSKGTITVVSGPQNRPVFPFQGGELDHANRLEACRVLATDAARSLRNGRSNARSEYAEILDQYIAYLPKQPGEGNFLLADAKARIIREMFAAEQDFLPVPFAAELKVLLEQHIGLRAYYPATEEFYESVRSGHLERPLPIDAAEEFIQGVRDNTPILFEPNVADTLQGVAQPLPQISKYEAGFGANIPPRPVPPPDPIEPIDPEKSQHFTLASGINAVWKVMSSGKKADENLEGWSKVIATLGPYAAPILEWLRFFVLGR